ncbi:hypothetical protein [Candidatus Finniella inopinata]|uniref:Uncharacterized protein n=1 Tax=Candidatus Finniella inopinata TaxID=1696036 RepID=A0A4Q7DNT6_9PROT|nr:hypothetical protein [Candidatus Finniella inopinata]RZI46586.1 hypothetical protein EQU50_03090 [Candidatus Finniella inopinata]
MAHGHAGDHFDDDDYLMQATIALSVEEQNQREQAEMGRAIKLSIQPQQSSAKQTKFPLFAHVTQLLKKQDQSIDRLFKAPDYTEWQKLWSIVGLKNTLTAVDVVLQLNDLKESCHKDNDAGLIGLADHALLQIFSGCWGVSDKRADSDTEEKLKRILRKVGQTFAERKRNAEKFNETIFGAFNAHGILKSQPHLNGHFFTVFQCLGAGYNGTSEVSLEFLLKGKGFFQSIQIDGRQFDAFFERTGHLVTLESLVESGHLKGVISLSQIEKLETYLKDFDPDGPHVQANLENLKTLWRLLMAQSREQTSTPHNLAQLLFKGILNGVEDDNRKTLIDIVVESMRFREFNGVDAAYDAALAGKTVSQWEPEKGAKTLDEGGYNWLIQYISRIHNGNKIKREAFLVKYKGVSYFRRQPRGAREFRDMFNITSVLRPELQRLAHREPNADAEQEEVEAARASIRIKELIDELAALGETENLDQGTEVTQEHFNWLNVYSHLPLARVEEGRLETGAIKDPRYNVQDEDDHFANRGRALDYLITQGKIDRSLKLPILLMLNATVLD